MNYMAAFFAVAIGTVLTLLGGDTDKAYWLFVSDINVAIALFLAWCFEPITKRHPSKGITIHNHAGYQPKEDQPVPANPPRHP